MPDLEFFPCIVDPRPGLHHQQSETLTIGPHFLDMLDDFVRPLISKPLTNENIAIWNAQLKSQLLEWMDQERISLRDKMWGTEADHYGARNGVGPVTGSRTVTRGL